VWIPFISFPLFPNDCRATLCVHPRGADFRLLNFPLARIASVSGCASASSPPFRHFGSIFSAFKIPFDTVPSASTRTLGATASIPFVPGAA